MRKPATVKTTSAAPATRAAPAAEKPVLEAVSKPAAKLVLEPAAKPATVAASAPAAQTPAPGKAVAAKPAPAAAHAKPAVKAASAKVDKVAKAAPAPKSERTAGAKRAVAPATQATQPIGEPVREKARKAKLVRDSFTMPEHEYELLGQVKKACLKAGFEIKKSELLRIGVALIGQLDLATLQNVLASLPQLKTGRPKES